jgi:hypothetical protein
MALTVTWDCRLLYAKHSHVTKGTQSALFASLAIEPYPDVSHRISYLSKVVVPWPDAPLRVVIRSTLVGMRTGPLTFKFLPLAPLMSSAQTAQATDGEKRAQYASTRESCSHTQIIALQG